MEEARATRVTEQVTVLCAFRWGQETEGPALAAGPSAHRVLRSQPVSVPQTIVHVRSGAGRDRCEDDTPRHPLLQRHASCMKKRHDDRQQHTPEEEPDERLEE